MPAVPDTSQPPNGPDGFPDGASALRAEAWATRCDNERRRRHHGHGYAIFERLEMREGLAAMACRFGGFPFTRAVNAMLERESWSGDDPPSEQLERACRDQVAILATEAAS